MKTCRKCGLDKPLSEFYFDPRRQAYSSPCKKCRISAVRLLDNRWRKENHEVYRASSYRRKLMALYGITPEILQAMLATQDGKCAITSCRKPLDLSSKDKRHKPHIDHDHVTGEVRGLLCLTCNTGIGMLGDSVEMLEAAKQYLLRATCAV